MATQYEIKTRIAEIDAKLLAGVQSVTTDGTSTTLNLSELRKERSELEKHLQSTRRRKPASARIDLGGF
jgi:hypothetical protein